MKHEALKPGEVEVFKTAYKAALGFQNPQYNPNPTAVQTPYMRSNTPAQPAQPNPAPFDLSQIGTVVVGEGWEGWYSLVLSKDETKLGYLVGYTSPLNTNAILEWKTPREMVEFLGTFDILNQNWIDFKSGAIGWIMGKFKLDIK
jgi:hypothetical protein